MKKTTLVIILCVAAVIIALVYWFMVGNSSTSTVIPDSTTQTSAPTDSVTSNQPTDAAEATGTPVLSLGQDDTLGVYLKSAATSMTLYTYQNDSPNQSNCTGNCATNWPPYTVASPDNLTSIGIPGTVGTITRADGTYQVTYNSMPLYFYIKDTVQGDLTGNGVGGVWSVAVPSQSTN